MLTTHQLEVESEGRKESVNYTGGLLGGQIELAWLGQDTGETPNLCDKCPGIFYDFSESGPRFYVSSDGRHLPQHSVPVNGLGHRD